MRLVAWNCAGAFHRKVGHLSGFSADIAVISEVRDESLAELPAGSPSVAWHGITGKKGVAVIGFNGWTIELAQPQVSERIFLPVVARRGPEEIQIIGVCVQSTSNYVTPTLSALESLRDFITRGPTVIAGDFNQSVVFDPGWGPEVAASRMFCL